MSSVVRSPTGVQTETRDGHVVDRHTLTRRQREEFGGMKFGGCFFGWLAATGTAVLLVTVLAAAGTALGLSKNVTVTQATSVSPSTISLVGGIALLVVILVSYFCGGYVAGRMARFNGVKQGIGVWLWALIVAVVVAILTLIAGNRYDVLARLNGYPRIPLSEGSLTTGGIIAAVSVAVVALVGAILGGLAGMRFHRRVDRVEVDDL